MSRDLLALRPVHRALRFRPFQFLAILPAALLVAVVVASCWLGVDHPGFNFGTVFTWVVWWGSLLLSFVFLGRAWCLVCPVGAVGEWIQRLSFWGRSSRTAGLLLPWPRPLRNLWLATALFLAFLWLDNGYGLSNSPRLTAGLIVVLTLASAWIGLLFERRAFCRYLCPLTAFIGVNSLFSILELRSRDAGVCRTDCPTKDCYRGNATTYGCPMGEFPGGAMDTNLLCILCTECVKGCGHDNIGLRLRPPGRDLWAMRRPRLDGAFAAVTVAGLATVAPLLTYAWLPATRRSLAAVLPAGTPPNDPPRLLAVALLFALGIGASAGLLYGSSLLSRRAAGVGTVPARTLFAHCAYAFAPLGLFKLLADLLDHALRTWGTLGDVTRALMLDFPRNRVVGGRVTVVQLAGPVPAYLMQTALLLAGLLFTLYALHRICLRLFADRDAALAAFLPMAGLGLLLTLLGLWMLGASLL
ncbi:MAG TPA: 4Fe-4S binding protein [Myxococcales bacterium]|nr:4Fe-4S binding protein [Myxococcales bacterium]